MAETSRKRREDSCVCTVVVGPNGVFTNTSSRSSSRAPEARNGSELKKARDTRMRFRSSSRALAARNGSDSSKVKNKKARDTKKSSKPSSASDDVELWGKGLGPVPIFRDYPFSIDDFARLTCPNCHKMTALTKSEMEKQETNQRTLCGTCQRKTDSSQSTYWCKRCKQPNGDRVIICNECYFENAPSTGAVIASMLKDCANMELQLFPVLSVMKKSKRPCVSDLPWQKF